MYNKILIPIVFDSEPNTEASFRIAQKLADASAELIVMHVIDHIPSYAAAQIPQDLLEKSQKETEQALERAASAVPGAKPLLIHGHPGQAIVSYAERNAIECIVLASHRPGIQNFFIGSTAERVVRHAPCSVHVIR